METYTEWLYHPSVESDIDDVLSIVIDMERTFFVPASWVESEEFNVED